MGILNTTPREPSTVDKVEVKHLLELIKFQNFQLQPFFLMPIELRTDYGWIFKIWRT